MSGSNTGCGSLVAPDPQDQTDLVTEQGQLMTAAPKCQLVIDSDKLSCLLDKPKSHAGINLHDRGVGEGRRFRLSHKPNAVLDIG